jgi:hypothetical protein
MDLMVVFSSRIIPIGNHKVAYLMLERIGSSFTVKRIFLKEIKREDMATNL